LRKLQEAELQQAKMNKVDKQLGLKNRNCTSASRISAQNLSRDLKQELGDWRQQKADNEAK
jgi:hypothetical protein